MPAPRTLQARIRLQEEDQRYSMVFSSVDREEQGRQPRRKTFKHPQTHPLRTRPRPGLPAQSLHLLCGKQRHRQTEANVSTFYAQRRMDDTRVRVGMGDRGPNVEMLPDATRAHGGDAKGVDASESKVTEAHWSDGRSLRLR